MALEIIGTIVGLAYLWLEYRASIHLWIASIIMPAIYGWLVWKFGHRSKGGATKMPITHMPQRSWLKAGVVYVVAQFFIAWVLINFTDSDVPWWDAFTTALSIVGMWMLARKYLEQWWIWIVVDVVCIGLYIYKELYFTAGLYALYAIIAIFGWLNWKKLMK